MIKVVIDTNILVSALLSPFGAPGRILDMIISGNLIACYDSRILVEYKDVLERPKFGFSRNDVRSIIDFICTNGVSVIAVPLAIELPDEDDRVFLEVAKHCDAYLVTGNMKHYPEDARIVTAVQFLNL